MQAEKGGTPNNWISFGCCCCCCCRCSTKGKSDAIGCAAFIDFLNDKQRDPRLNEILYPLYNEKRATEIIDEYEQDKENRARSTWQAYVTSAISFREYYLMIIELSLKFRTIE